MNRREAIGHIGKSLTAGTIFLLGSIGKMSTDTRKIFGTDDFLISDNTFGPMSHEEYKRHHSIEAILEGGSNGRQEIMRKLEDGPTMMRHSTNLRPDVIRAHALTKPNYTINEGDIAEINRTNERLHDYGLDGLVKGVSMKVAIDPEFYLSKISTESVGDPYAVSSAGALGIAQIMPNTYTELRNNTNGTISRLQEYLPKDTLNDLLERPLRDLLLLTPEIARNMDIPLDNESMWIKEGIDKHLNIWLPYGIVALREFGEFPGTGQPVYEALINPKTGLEAGALTALNFWLYTYSPMKKPNTLFHNNDPGQGLVAPAYPLIPQAPASAYIRGQNGVHGTISRMVESAVEPYTILEGMDIFENMNTRAGNVYSAELMRKYEYLKRTQS